MQIGIEQVPADLRKKTSDPVVVNMLMDQVFLFYYLLSLLKSLCLPYQTWVDCLLQKMVKGLFYILFACSYFGGIRSFLLIYAISLKLFSDFLDFFIV